MGIPGSANLMLLGGGAAEAYQIEQSLRFDGSSGYLSRTHSNSNTSSDFTLSMWLKKAYVGEDNMMLLHTNTDPRYSYVSFGESSGDADLLIARGTSSGYAFNTSRKYRDPSAWFHIVLSVDVGTLTEGYVNGVLDQNTGATGSWHLNGSDAQAIGRQAGVASNFFSGYMAEVHFIDGQALGADSFGEFDDNGVWRPIEYTGTYGDNGYYLKFDPDATNGVGHDHSGNGNNWTASGFTTSGAGSDVVNDTPTTNHATMLPTWPFGVSQAYARYFAEANQKYHSGRNSPALAYPSILLPKSGKYYVEFTITAGGSGGSFYAGNLFVISNPKTGNSYGTSITSYEGGYGATTYNGSAGTSGSNWRSGPHNVAIAIDMDTGDVEYFLAGVSQSTGTISAANLALDNLCITVSGATGSSTTVTYDINFGTRDFVYTPPTGYTGLGTATMPEPDIKNPGEHFKAVTYTGSNSSQSIDCGFQPDMIWIKCRNDTRDHKIVDVLRGTTKYIVPNQNYSESTHTDFVTSFNSDGFTVAGNAADTNQSGKTYVAWCWKAGGSGSSNTAGSITSTVSANPSAGFSIVGYSGGSTGSTVGHGLGVAPKMIWVKNRSSTSDWMVWQDGFSSSQGLNLNLPDAKFTSGSNTFIYDVTSTTFKIGTSSIVNAGSNNFVAYCFAEVEGYSKFHTYTGNGSSDGPLVYCGFRPAFVIYKRTGGSDNWFMYDTTRDDVNVSYKALRGDQTTVEKTSSTDIPIDILSNGFKIKFSGTAGNGSGEAILFVAFAEHPFGGENVSPATAR